MTMFGVMGALWGYLALLLLLQVATVGEAAVPSAGLHPAMTRATVVWARIAMGWILILLSAAFIGL
jgi:hypothetical protein